MTHRRFWWWFFHTRLGQRIGRWAERDTFPTTEAGWSGWIWRWRVYFWGLALLMVAMEVMLFVFPHQWFGVSRGSFSWWFVGSDLAIGLALTISLGWVYPPDYRRRLEALRARGWGYQGEEDEHASV